MTTVQKIGTPAEAVIQCAGDCLKTLDSGLRRNDGRIYFLLFCEGINHDCN